jgi:D-serine deaminase-like pyridoxal phosphate-dependent protein
MSWYEINNLSDFDSPALIIYKERVKQNIARAIQMTGDASRLRPHVKTNKIAEVCIMMMDAGIRKFKCATIAEAEMLGMISAPDVLIAYQPVGVKIQRFINLVKLYPQTKFSCLVDNTDHATELSRNFLLAGITGNVFMDVNVGMNRTGIKSARALQLFEHCMGLSNLNPLGLHGYDGQITDTDIEKRKQLTDDVYGEELSLADQIKKEFNINPVMVTGGSPTFPLHAARHNIECSPGTFVFWDWGYHQKYPEQPFEPAALVITRVISIIDEQTICVDLGHKSVASEMPLPRVHFLNAPNAIAVSHSEEHLVLKVEESRQYKLGDVLYGVPVHICPTVALYDKALVAEDHVITGSWNVVARNRSIGV